MRKLVTAQGEIRWRELLGVLPPQELIPAASHPQIQLLGNLPLHFPVTRISRIRGNAKGLIFSTESGHQLQILCENIRMIDMLEEQAKLLEHPTWSELAQFMKLPRRAEFAEAAAIEVLQSHAEHTSRIQVLEQILGRTL
jgi:hypothetical protein